MAIPENRKIPSIQVKDLLDPNPRIFGEINALAVLKSPYIEPATAVANFVTSGTKGSPVLPVYDSFSITEASVIDANKFNKYVFYFSCVTEPAVTANPASYVVKTGTILTGLANLNKIEMTVDYNVSGIIKVFMTITQMAGANLDPDAGEPLETAGFALLFDTNRNYSDANEPVYHFMSGNLSGAVNGSVATMAHSALVVPEFLIPPKPISPLAVYTELTNPTSPLATYGTQAAMTADFANQVLDSYYYFTGNTGAYKYNGTATDSINNYVRELYMLGDQSAQVTGEHYYYTGSTSAWEKTATSTGLIANYTEEVAVSGWAEWGTKPAWLTLPVTPYLVGADNLNNLTFTYDAGAVTTVNSTAVAGNLDAGRLTKLHRLIEHDYNENASPIETDSIVNKSIYGDYFSTEMTNTAEASYVLLGGSNYALSVGNGGDNSSTVRAMRSISMPEGFDRFFTEPKMTFVWKGELRNTGTNANRALLSNTTSLAGGFAVQIPSDFKIGFRISAGTTAGSFASYYAPINSISQDTGQWTIIVVFDRDLANADKVKIFRGSPANAIDFERLASDSASSSTITLVGGLDAYSLEVEGGGTGRRGTINDHLILENRALSDAEVEAIYNQLNP